MALSAEAQVLSRARMLMDGAEGPGSARLRDAANCLTSLPWSSLEQQKEMRLLRAAAILRDLGFSDRWPTKKPKPTTNAANAANAANTANAKAANNVAVFPLRSPRCGLDMVAAALAVLAWAKASGCHT